METFTTIKFCLDPVCLELVCLDPVCVTAAAAAAATAAGAAISSCSHATWMSKHAGRVDFAALCIGFVDSAKFCSWIGTGQTPARSTFNSREHVRFLLFVFGNFEP